MGAIASLTCAAIAAGGLTNSHVVACEATELLLEVCLYLRRTTCHLGSWHVNHAYMRRCFEGSKKQKLVGAWLFWLWCNGWR